MMWCNECGKRFTGERSFNKHRVGTYEKRDRRGHLLQENTRRCLTDEEMQRARWQRNAKGVWIYDPGRPNPFSKTPRT